MLSKIRYLFTSLPHESVASFFLFLSSFFMSVFFFYIYWNRSDPILLNLVGVFGAYSFFMLLYLVTFRFINHWITRFFVLFSSVIIIVGIMRNVTHVEGLLLLTFIPFIIFFLLPIRESFIWAILFLVSVVWMLVSDQNMVSFTQVESFSIFFALLGLSSTLGVVVTRMRIMQNEIEITHKNEEQSKKALESIIGTQLVVYAFYDDKGVITYISKRSLALLGLKRDECLGKSYKKVYKENNELILGLNVAFEKEYAKFIATVCDKVFEFHITKLYDEKMQKTYFTQVAFDVSEKISVKNALQENEYYLANVLDMTFEAVILTLDGIIVKANHKALEFFGHENMDDILNRHLRDFVTPASMEEISRHIQSNSEESYTIKGIRKDQTIIPVEVKGRNIDLFGRRYRVSVIQDIQTIQEAKNEIAKLARAVEQSASMIMITNKEGYIEYVNRSFETSTGYSRKELLGKKPNMLSSGYHDTDFFDDMWKAILSKQSWTHELYNKKHNGEIYISKNHISSVTNEEGEITHFISVQEDITEQKTQEKQMLLQAKQADIGELLSMIAHQWRQPLATISAIGAKIEFAIELDTLQTKELKEDLHSIDNEVQYLSKIISDFGKFFSPDKDIQEVKISSLIDKTLLILEEQIRIFNIDVIVEYEEDYMLHTYVNEMIQVLFNIVQNSIEQIELTKAENKTVRISVSQDEYEFIIDIEDHAGGIAEELIDNIFLPYVSTKKVKHGVGLGLYMSHTIVENHCKGNMYVNNSESGVIFTITLPKKRKD